MTPHRGSEEWLPEGKDINSTVMDADQTCDHFAQCSGVAL